MSEMRPLALPSPQAQQAQAYLTFRTGSQWYAIDVLAVFEVANMVAISSLPDMPPAIIGMVNIRGAVVPIVDLRLRFHAPNRSLELTTPIIFLHQADVGTYGIVVDDVDDVISLKPSAISQTSLSQRARHILGLTDVKGRLIMLLDPKELILSSLEGQSLEMFNIEMSNEPAS